VDQARGEFRPTKGFGIENHMKEIAWKVGYEDYGAFRRVFQKVMGLSPGDYRLRFFQRNLRMSRMPTARKLDCGRLRHAGLSTGSQ